VAPSPAVRTIRFVVLDPLALARSVGSSVSRAPAGHAGDRPDEADHLAGDRGGDYDLGLAGCGQAPISRAQPDLRFPRDVPDHRGQRLETVVQLAADPRAVMRYVQAPSISTRRASALPALVIPPRRIVLPDECSLGTKPR